MEKIKIGEEDIYLKKGKTWRVVYPYKIDGKINWMNLISGGDWFNLVKIGIIVVIILFCLNDWSTAIKTANECLNKTQIIIP
jgi:hypothetical protein